MPLYYEKPTPRSLKESRNHIHHITALIKPQPRKVGVTSPPPLHLYPSHPQPHKLKDDRSTLNGPPGNPYKQSAYSCFNFVFLKEGVSPA